MAGAVHLITLFVEKRYTAFSVSRLVMLSGINVRNYTEATPDDPVVIEKVRACLPQILSPEELQALDRLLTA